MLPAVLKQDIDFFGKENDIVYYALFREPKLLAETGNEWFFEIRNKQGREIVTEANPNIFKMYRIK